MILKSADDKSKRIALLEELQRSTLLDAYQRNWLSEELGRLKKVFRESGIQPTTWTTISRMPQTTL